jgi:hypothetical protein
VVGSLSMDDWIPCPDPDTAPIPELLAFALTYNAYGRIADDLTRLERVVRPVIKGIETRQAAPPWVGLDLLRAALFFVQRRGHNDFVMSPDQERHMRLLASAVRTASPGGLVYSDTAGPVPWGP